MDDRGGRARCWEAVVSQHVVPVEAEAVIYAREIGAVDNAACATEVSWKNKARATAPTTF